MYNTFLLCNPYYTYNNKDTVNIYKVWIIIERAEQFLRFKINEIQYSE